MAYTPLKISIPKPCHEDWNGMHPVPGTTARHCDSCAKNVVDFTGFSDAKMHADVRKQGGKLCGRFRPDQLDRPLRAVSTPTRNPLKVAAAAAGVLLAATGCQTSKEVAGAPMVKETREMLLEGIIALPMMEDISLEQAETHLTISLEPEIKIAILGGIAPPLPPPPQMVGEISAELLQPPLAYEETTVLAGKPSVQTFEDEAITTCGRKEEDSITIEGEIEILEEDFLMGDIEPVAEELSPPPLLIEQNTTPPSGEVLTNDTFPKPPQPPPFESMPIVMGIVTMDHPRPTGMDWVKDTVKNILPSLPTLPSKDPSLHQRPRPETPQYLEALTVFPNPFVDHLKIEINLPAKETLMVELIDPAGRLVFARGWEVDAGVNTLKIEPKRRKLKHAIYFLRVTNGEGFSVQRAVIRG